MKEAQDELHEKVEMFNGAEGNLNKMQAEMNKMHGKLKTNTNLMNQYDLEKQSLETKLLNAEMKIKELTYTNQDQSSQIALISKHEHERQVSWLEEVERNKQLIE